MHQPEEGHKKVRLKVNSLREVTMVELVPQQAGEAVAVPRECVCARARDDGTWWHYQFLEELLRNIALVRHVSQLYRDGVENLFDVSALDSAGFAVNYGRDKAWRVIIPHGKAIVMGEFAGLWFETEVV